MPKPTKVQKIPRTVIIASTRPADTFRGKPKPLKGSK